MQPTQDGSQLESAEPIQPAVSKVGCCGQQQCGGQCPAGVPTGAPGTDCCIGYTRSVPEMQEFCRIFLKRNKRIAVSAEFHCVSVLRTPPPPHFVHWTLPLLSLLHPTTPHDTAATLRLSSMQQVSLFFGKVRKKCLSINRTKQQVKLLPWKSLVCTSYRQVGMMKTCSRGLFRIERFVTTATSALTADVTHWRRYPACYELSAHVTHGFRITVGSQFTGNVLHNAVAVHQECACWPACLQSGWISC